MRPTLKNWNQQVFARCFLAAAALAMVQVSLRAELVSVSGNGDIIDPQEGGATANFFQDKGKTPLIHGWNEAQGFTLSEHLYVDLVDTGTYNNGDDLADYQAARVEEGTVVDSHLLYFDPEKGGKVKDVTFTFRGKILGVIVESDRFYKSKYGKTDYFVDSDFLRNPLTLSEEYPGSHFNNRGLELGSSSDSTSLSIVDNTLTINVFRASSPGDQIRVITMAIPEPSTFLSFGVSMIALGVFRRRGAR